MSPFTLSDSIESSPRTIRSTLAAWRLLASLLLLSGCGSDAGVGPDASEDLEIVQARSETGASADVDLYLMRADGTSGRRLTGMFGVEFFPEWSPDGRQVLFARLADDRQWLVDSDGSGLRTLETRPSDNARWSPDGAWIVFHRVLGAITSELVVMHPDGSGERSVTRGLVSQPYGAPSWSADGRIAFRRGDGMSGIWTVKSDGSTLAQLTADPGDQMPRWSRDGTHLALQSGVVISQGWRQPIAVVNADGSGRRVLTTPGASDVDQNPTWSPDGEWILFERQSYQSSTPMCALMKVSMSSGASVVVRTPSPGLCFGASWRPAGSGAW
ncbi:MAG: TolB family protein [Gemmatimonadaceae bacterium]